MSPFITHLEKNEALNNHIIANFDKLCSHENRH